MGSPLALRFRTCELHVARGQTRAEDFAVGHDLGLWTCLCRLLNVNPDNNSAKVTAGIPLCLGGLGLRSATRTRHSAFWASWADSLSMIKARHPVVAERIIGSLNNARPAGPCIRSAVLAAFQLMGIEGFEVPSWEALADGLRTNSREPEDTEPGGFKHGWQHEAASRVERHHRDHMVMPTWADHEKGLMRSQSGPFAGVALSVAPINFLTRIDPSLFRVLLLRRLRLPLPLSLRFCRCGRPLDPCGHHRAACSRAGLLGRRGFAAESAAARVCREAGLWPSRMPMMPAVWRSSSTVCPCMEARNWRLTPLWCLPFGAMDCQAWYREHRWHHPGPGPAQKRAYIPGVGWSPFPCAPCGLGRRGRRQVVGGDANVPPHFGTRESPIRAANLEEESRAGLEDALGRNPGVQRCSRVCRLHPRPPRWRRG